MIKGVNRQMIEVSDTGNPYFERALLVVRPGFQDNAGELLRQEAQRFLQRSDGYAGLRRQRRLRRLQRAIYGVLCAGAGGLVGCLLSLLCR